MRVVIDIPEEDFEHIKLVARMRNEEAGLLIMPHSYVYIANGAPLPKGHGRLIDADACEKEMNKSEVEADRNADYYTADKIDCAMEYIINAPTIIEADKEGAE